MTTKQATSTKKRGAITRSERASAVNQAETILNKIKGRTGEVIHVAITDRTTIELPASLSQEEIDARVEKYYKLYKIKR